MSTTTPTRSCRAVRRTPRPYASENDVASAGSLAKAQPETPQKKVAATTTATAADIAASLSRRSKKNKSLPLKSDGPVRPVNNPIQNSASSSRQAAFAGVFSASPAASSLSVPTFCFKPSPPTESASNQESDDLSTGTAPTSTAWDGSGSPPLFEESPLDRMFRADMEQRRAKLANNSQSAASPTPQLPSGRPGISLRELDGALDAADAPAIPVTYQQRLLEAKLRSSSGSAAYEPTLPSASQDAADRTEALKRYLFGAASGTQLKAPVNASVPPTPPHSSPPNRLQSPWPDNQSQRSPVVLAMEDSLRRVLKLDSTLSAHSVG